MHIPLEEFVEHVTWFTGGSGHDGDEVLDAIMTQEKERITHHDD